MRKIGLLIISLLLIIGVVGCSSADTPEEVVAKGITSVKELDLVKMQKYFESDDITEEEDIFGEDFEGQDMDMFKLLIENIEYEIISSEIDGDEAVVETKLTNLDMASIMQEYIAQAFVLALGSFKEEVDETDEAEMEAKMEQIFVDLLSREENKTVTNTVKIELNKVDGEWKMELDSFFIDALFGGLMNSFDGFGE